MNVQTPTRLTAAEENLVAQLESVGAGEAATRFRTAGLPTRRVEAYHYTDLKVLLSDVPPLAGASAGEGVSAFEIPGAYRIAMTNGALADTPDAPAGVVVGSVDGSPLTVRDDTVVRLNAALVKQAVNVELSGAVDQVIHIDRHTNGDAAHVATGSRITVAPGASATIVETVSTSDAGHMGNLGSYVAVGSGATVTHIVVDLSAGQASQFSTLEYRIDAEAKFKSVVIQAGADLARAQIFAEIVGEKAHADFLGLNLVDADQHRDITLDLTHAVPNTTSTELYKQIGRGHGKGIFQGKITVARDAQKTDAKMMSQALMLTEGAEIQTKPELVIYADDVVCGHGATCGDLDETWMFYLMSRGIPKAEAETMLIRAFLEEIVDAVADEPLSDALSGIVDLWLAKGA